MREQLGVQLKGNWQVYRTTLSRAAAALSLIHILCVGGDWNYGSSAGLFCFNGDSGSSGSYSRVGARLLFVP